MKKRIMYCVFTLFVFSSIAYCMEIEQPKSNGQQGGSNTIIVVDPEKPGATDNDKGLKIPGLNLGSPRLQKSMTNLQKLTNRNAKPPIQSHSALLDKVKETVTTHRAQQTERTKRGISNIGQESISMQTPNNKTILKDIIDDTGVIKDISGKLYSHDEVWDFLKKINPTLYSFAQDHGMDLDKMMMYANLLGEMDVTPHAVLDFMQTHHNLTSTSSELIKGYEAIQKKNPEQYEKIVLEVLKTMCDQEANGGKPTAGTALSSTNQTHIGLLEDRVNSQNTQIYRQWGALLVSVVTTVGPLIWAIYQKVTNNPHGPNMTTF